MNDIIQLFARSTTLAIVGASDNRQSFGNIAFRTLKSKGYQLYPVNPKYPAVEGEPCYGSLRDLPAGVESALFVLPSRVSEQAVVDAQLAGIKQIWFQRGADYSDAIRAAQKAGIETVSGRCILMYAEPVTGFHAFHRFLAKLFGRL